MLDKESLLLSLDEVSEDELSPEPADESEPLDESPEELSPLDEPESPKPLPLELPDELLPLLDDDLPLLLDDELLLPDEPLDPLEQQSQQQQPAWWLNCQSPVCLVSTPPTSCNVIVRV